MTRSTAFDVAVVGAGAAGLHAALAAARAGASTVVVDACERPGGQYYRQPSSPTRPSSTTQVAGRRLADDALAAGVELRLGTTVWDAAPTSLQLIEEDELSTLEFGALVVATGAHERVAAFPGWTLPGVYTAGAIQSLLKEHGVVPGRRVLFAGSGPLSLVVAAALARRSASVVGVFEATRVVRAAGGRPWLAATGLWSQGGRIRELFASVMSLARAGTPVRTGWGIVRVLGDQRVQGAVIARFDREWRPIEGSERALECDTVAIHYSLVPSTELLRLLGTDVTFRPERGGWVPVRSPWLETSVPGVFAAGDCSGIGGVGLSSVEGRIAGLGAAQHALGLARADGPPPAAEASALVRERRFQTLYGSLFHARPGLTRLTHSDTIVCRCEDVPRREVDAAIAAGAQTALMVKSLTRCGMGPCQGRVCLPLIEQVVAETTGRPPVVPTARAPLVPIPFEAMREW